MDKNRLLKNKGSDDTVWRLALEKRKVKKMGV